MVEAVTELPCARCERPCRRTRDPWPEGVICEACRKQASRRRGTCATCAVERLLPGNDGHGNPICVDCAGIPTSFRCDSCGVEDEFWYARTCLRCSLHRRLVELLDDGTRRVAPLLLPLLSALCAADPSRGLSWLRSAPVRDRLRALASGQVAITHAGLDVLGRSSGVEYLRDLLMAHGVLPRRDKHLAQFEGWAALRLETVAHAEDRAAITAYVRWHQLRRLRADASTGELGKSKADLARQQTNIAIKFLAWLRRRGLVLAACRQADLDAWLASPVTTRLHTRSFLVWAMDNGRCPRLVLPRHRGGVPRTMSQARRTELVAQLFVDESIELADRVAGCIILLYAQPIARVAQIKVAHLKERDQEVWLRLAGEAVPLPEPLGSLAMKLKGRRPNMATAANPESPWLFPGRSAGHPLEARQLARRLGRVGVSRLGRLAAFHQLVTAIPAPVLAELLGYNPKVAAERAAELATDWAGYAALKSRDA